MEGRNVGCVLVLAPLWVVMVVVEIGVEKTVVVEVADDPEVIAWRDVGSKLKLGKVCFVPKCLVLLLLAFGSTVVVEAVGVATREVEAWLEGVTTVVELIVVVLNRVRILVRVVVVVEDGVTEEI